MKSWFSAVHQGSQLRRDLNVEATKEQRGNVGREQHPVHDVKLRQSPFLNAFPKKGRVSTALQRGSGPMMSNCDCSPDRYFGSDLPSILRIR